MQPIAEHLWLLSYPLKVAGMDLRRNVTVVRLRSAEVVILSSGPFTEDEVTAVKAIGLPRWLVDAMLHHDTYSAVGWGAFPGIAFLAPPGFEEKVKFPVWPILPPPREWGDELLALELAGVPHLRETVFLHAPSRTLIVQDLVSNFSGGQPLVKELLLRLAVGHQHHPGIPRSFKFDLQDRPAFERSLGTMMAWDFDRVIVAHGDHIETNGKALLRAALTRAGF